MMEALSSSEMSAILMMETLSSSETSLLTGASPRNIPEDAILLFCRKYLGESDHLLDYDVDGGTILDCIWLSLNAYMSNSRRMDLQWK
jgi:hypothetical protein